jgi:hypothetical protein
MTSLVGALHRSRSEETQQLGPLAALARKGRLKSGANDFGFWMRSWEFRSYFEIVFAFQKREDLDS